MTCNMTFQIIHMHNICTKEPSLCNFPFFFYRLNLMEYCRPINLPFYDMYLIIGMLNFLWVIIKGREEKDNKKTKYGGWINIKPFCLILKAGGILNINKKLKIAITNIMLSVVRLRKRCRLIQVMTVVICYKLLLIIICVMIIIIDNNYW